MFPSAFHNQGIFQRALILLQTHFLDLNCHIFFSYCIGKSYQLNLILLLTFSSSSCENGLCGSAKKVTTAKLEIDTKASISYPASKDRFFGKDNKINYLMIKLVVKKNHLLFQMLSKGYSLSDALTDGLAGFTVALCVIPQSIAMAIIAELPPQVQDQFFLDNYIFW